VPVCGTPDHPAGAVDTYHDVLVYQPGKIADFRNFPPALLPVISMHGVVVMRCLGPNPAAGMFEDAPKHSPVT
jgi:hypothetical protein